MSESNKLFIQEFNIDRNAYPLKQTYNLSFAALTEFVSIQVTIKLNDGSERMAEVVPLVGYNDESEEKILALLQGWREQLLGQSLENARRIIEKEIPKSPFACSPILTAIDLFDFEITNVENDSLSYVIPTSTIETEKFKDLLLNSKATIKVKLLGDLEKDINGLKLLENEILEFHSKLRFDANQAYSYIQAKGLFSYLESSKLYKNVEYIEQPLKVGKESDLGKLREEFKQVNIMLDESVVVAKDLELAEKNDINFIKLKLFKQGGIKETIEIARLAVSMNIKVILGNGVATAVSNFVENEIYCQNRGLFQEALESNGFKKVAV